MTRCTWLLAVLLLLPLPTTAQVPPEKVLPTFTVAEGLELQLWASEPLFVNPTCIDIDHRGRVWVCESVNYRHKLMRRPTNRPAGDRIVILDDTDGDGKADKATTFYQAPDFLAPLGIAVAAMPSPDGNGGLSYKVYVCHSPDILLFTDANGDGQADGPPQKLLSGFKGYDHDHGVHGILIGPDGKLYFSVGDQGVQGLKDKYGKVWTTNHTDCRAGTIWRCDLDGQNLELLAHNFRNQYEPCVDSFGTIFVSDNDDDGNQQTRICYVMPGGNYGYWPRGPGQSHWHEEQPGIVPKVLRTGFGSPTGMCFYEGTLLPGKYRGQLLHTDAGPRELRCYHTRPNGAGYDLEAEILVTSSDNWFRPSDVCVAPDGSVFIADWYDPGVGGHGMGDTTRGRIYRLAPKGHRPSVPKLELDSDEGLLAALASPNQAVRHLAMSRLSVCSASSARPILETAARQKDNPALRARSLWQMASRGDWELYYAHFSDPDPRYRILTVRALQTFRDESPADYPSAWQRVMKHESAAEAREVLLALRNADPQKAKAMILRLAEKYDGRDRFYLNALGIAVGTDPKRREVILAEFDKHFPELNDKTLDLIWELRPPQVLPRLQKLLADAATPPAQRARIVDILAATEDARAGLTLLRALEEDLPSAVRDRALENLRQFLAGKWRSLRDRPELAQTLDRLLARPEARVAGLILVAAADRGHLVERVQAIARDGKEAVATRAAAVQALGQLQAVEAVAALEALLGVEPVALRREVVQALGQQLLREQRGSANPALKPLEELVRGKDQDLALRHAAVSALAGSQAGTSWLLALHDRKQLPEELRSETARLLRNSPYQGLRNRALLAFPPPARLDPKQLPEPRLLAARRGDAVRGRKLLADSARNDHQCLKCHTIRGVGGQVGPDLSAIGKKASRENLFESILLPNKAIADQFVSWVVETRQGQVLTGLIVEETAEQLTLRDANARDYRLAKKDIEQRQKSLTSLMPADLLAYLTEDDLVDMVEYLTTLQTPALALDYWHICGPFDNGAADAGLDQVFPPEREIDLGGTYAGKHGPVRWRVVQPDGQGYVDLQAFHEGKSDHTVSYLYRAVASPVEQEATILLGTDDGARLWVNGELVHTERQHRAATPEQAAVAVRLRKGLNRLLLKINNGHGPHGFYFTIVAAEELKRGDQK